MPPRIELGSIKFRAIINRLTMLAEGIEIDATAKKSFIDIIIIIDICYVWSSGNAEPLYS